MGLVQEINRTLAIPCRMIGMNSTLMISYIKFVADRLCLQLGYDKIYGDKNPLESISLGLKTNMHDAQISAYGLADKKGNGLSLTHEGVSLT